MKDFSDILIFGKCTRGIYQELLLYLIQEVNRVASLVKYGPKLERKGIL